MIRPSRLSFVFGLAVLAVVAIACGGGNKPELRRVEEGKSITVLRSDKSADLDPVSTSSGGDVRVLEQMYEHLVSASVDTDEVIWEKNGLAEDWTINDDHTVYTFTIRKGIKFHDGTELDAEAVKKSLDRMVVEDHPARPPSRPYRKGYFGEVKSVEVKDKHTVVVTHNSPNPRFLGTLGLHGAMIVSSKAIDHMASLKGADERRSWLTRNPAGTGPYTIAREGDYQSDESITLTAFEDYWRGKPTIERIVFSTATEVRSRTERILNGDVHFVDSLDPGSWDDFESNEEIILYTWQGQNLCYLAMNCNPEDGHPTADKRVREAIALAIDRSPMVAKFSGRAKPHHVLIPPTMMGFPGSGYRPQTDQGSVDERRERARNLLKEADAEGIQLNLYLPDTPRPYLLYPDDIANLIQQQLQAVGIRVVLDKAPLKELTPKATAGELALVLIGWMGDTGEPDNFWAPLLSGKDGGPADTNNARFYDAKVAELVRKAGVVTDVSEREKLYHQLEKSVHNEHRPMVPLLSAEQSYAWLKKLKEVEVDSTGSFRFYKAYIEE